MKIPEWFEFWFCHYGCEGNELEIAYRAYRKGKKDAKCYFKVIKLKDKNESGRIGNTKS